MELKTCLLLVLAVISTATAFKSLIQEGKTFTYIYRAIVDSTTNIPYPHASSFGLNGLLNVEHDGNSTLMQFTNLKYKLRNGDWIDWYDIEGKELPLPKGTEDFLKPFKVVHDEDGKGLGIIADSKLEYVLNFQKSVASVMQLDLKQIKLDSKKMQAFKTVENSIYGRGKVFYTVFPHAENVYITKMLDINGNSKYQNTLTNFKPHKCGEKYDHPVSRDSQRIFKVSTGDSENVIREINAEGATRYHPFNGQSEGFAIYVNQSMRLLEIKPVVNKIEVIEQELQSFDYNLVNFDSESSQSITHERRSWDMEKLVEKLEVMITDAFKYLKDFHLKIDMEDIKKGQVLNDIKKLMLELDLSSIEKLTDNVMAIKTDSFKELTQIYLQMLPLIGSTASIKHIMKMIKGKKLKEHVAIDMLQTFPEYVIAPNKDFIAEMEEMINWGDDYSVKLRKAGIYCFSRLLYKATYNVFDPQSNPTDYILEQPEEQKYFPSNKYYERYIVEFSKRLKETNDYNTKIDYILALYNTEMVEIVEHLVPIIKGELWNDYYLQVLAAFAVSPILNKNEDLVFELYWPIFIDQKQPLSNRAIVYYLLMESQPNMSKLINILWLFERESDSELYKFHYSYLQALSKTTEPCKANFKLRVSQIFRYIDRPMEGISSFNLVDFRDAKYGFGKALDYIFINSPKSSEMIFKLGSTTYMNSASVNDFKFYIRCQGLSENIFKKIKLQISETTDQLFNYDDVINILKRSRETNFDIHVVIVKKNKIIMDYHIDSSNYQELLMELSFWFLKESKAEKKIVNINYPLYNTIYLPTDIGFPSTFETNVPSLSHFDYIMTKESESQYVKYHIDYIIKLWSHAKTGLSFYNPIADVWQGIHKYRSFDAAAPIMFDVYFNIPQQNVKISWTRFGNDMENHIGYRSHVKTMTSVEDDFDNKLLQECMAIGQNYEIVSKGDIYRREYTLLDDEIPLTGHHHSLVAFDSERYMENASISNMLENFDERILKNSNTGLQNILANIVIKTINQVFQPTPASNGFLYRFKFSEVNPATQNDLTVRFIKEYKFGKWVLAPATKYSGRLTYTLKNNNQTVVTWDVFANMDQNDGHSLTNFKVHITKNVPEQMDFKICMEGYKKWNEANVEGYLNISTSYPGTKCHDTPLLQINMLGEQLEDQQTNRDNYLECSDEIWSDLDYEKTIACYASYSSIRKYTYTFLGTDTPVEFHKIFHSVLNRIKAFVRKHLMITTAATEKLGANDRKMVVEYPMLNDKVANFKIYSNEFDIEMNSVPVEDWLNLGIHPDNLHYTRLFEFMYNSGLTETCFIEKNNVLDIGENSTDILMTDGYRMYLGDSAEDCKNGVFVRNIETLGKMAVKFIHETEYLEIIPTQDGFQFAFQGSKLDSDVKTKSKDWIYFNYIESTGLVNILMHNLGVYFLFDGYQLKVVIPQSNMVLHGLCNKKY